MPKPYPLECIECKKKYLKPQGFCQCGASQSIKPINNETLENRRVRRRWKNSEREIARKMLAVDGPDPMFKNITSSTSRTGHISSMRVDAVTKNFVIENKNKALPKWVIDAWILIQQRARDFNKHALLHMDPPNLPKDCVLNGVKYKLETMAIITEPRHEDLIVAESTLYKLLQDLDTVPEARVAVDEAFASLSKIKNKAKD